MRDDMARVIVERPRRGGGGGRKGRKRQLDELPQQQGLRRFQREHGGYKSLNENLAPLRRFLDKQVGRPWDKVYAEVSARLRADNVVQQHVRDHLKDFVAIKPRRGVRPRYRWQPRSEGLWHQPLYVDPRDGILKRTDRLPEEKARLRKAAEARRKGAAGRARRAGGRPRAALPRRHLVRGHAGSAAGTEIRHDLGKAAGAA